MLTELHVESVGIFEDASFECGPGLTVVTGETGAGKTLLVESLGALLGRRVDSHLIGPAAAHARIDGRFQNGDHECVLSRVITESRSKAYVDLRPATIQALSERAHGFMSLTSQGEIDTSFTDEALRAALSRIDRSIAGLEAEYAAAWNRRRKIEQRIGESGGNERESAQMLDLYQFQLVELNEANLEDPNEYTTLDAQIDVLRQSDDIRRAIELALTVLSSGAGDGILQTIGALQKFEFFRVQVDRLSGVQAEMDDVVIELRSARDALADDAGQLERGIQRQHQLKGLMRKYGESLSAVIEYRDALQSRIDGLLHLSQNREELEREREAVLGELRGIAATLCERRAAVGADLSRRIEEHLHALHMDAARVELRVQPASLHSSGADRIEMWLAANRGSDLKPLEAVASGGERSRILLGLQLEVLPQVETVIFDEIDAGIGGATGQSVGQHLAELAKTRQVLCVTHLPQVAAFADAHVVIRKHDDGARVRAQLATLDTREERMQELARMLAGMEGSQNAQEHASELLDQAAQKKSA